MATTAPPVRLAGLRRVGDALSLATRASPKALTLYVLMTVTAGVAPVAVAWLTKLVIDTVVEQQALSRLTWLAVGLAAAGVAAGVLPVLTQYVRAELERGIGLLATDRLFGAVDRFVGLGRFENPDFLNRMRLAQQMGGMSATEVVAGSLSIAQASITVFGFLAALTVINPVMTIVVLCAAVPGLAVEIALSRQRAQTLLRVSPAERREYFYQQLLTSEQGAKELRLFGSGGYLRAKMLADRRLINAAKRSLDRRHVTAHTALGVLVAAVAAAGLLWAAGAAAAGRLSPGAIAVFVATLAGVQGSLGTLAANVAHLHHSLLVFDHYRSVTTAEPDLPRPATVAPLPALRRGIELRDVWFRYTDEHPWVLQGVNLFIPKGSAVALVGENGAGKSTVVKLLCRFYDPTKGSIHWDGVDIRDVDPVELRQRMTAVFQDFMSYDLTARENIGLGDVSAMDDLPRIRRAARGAGMHEQLARLPRGYETSLSRVLLPELDGSRPETGVELSGGQWQRLALARAFLREGRDLMILDEPSSGLDAEAEQTIHAALTRHRADRTSLLISHRLSTVRDADLIVVLDQGRVVESGDHNVLVSGGGEYARLFALQARGYTS